MPSVGIADDWAQAVVALAPADGSSDLQVTPNTGKARISYVDAASARRYWNGSTFVAGPAIELATTIVGKLSTRAFTPPSEVAGRDVLFEGWIDGSMATFDSVSVRYEAGSAPDLSFG